MHDHKSITKISHKPKEAKGVVKNKREKGRFGRYRSHGAKMEDLPRDKA